MPLWHPHLASRVSRRVSRVTLTLGSLWPLGLQFRMKCSHSFGLLHRRSFQPPPQSGTRRRHKYRVKPGSAALVLSSLSLYVSFCSSCSLTAATLLAASSLLTAAFFLTAPFLLPARLSFSRSKSRWAENIMTQMSCWLEPKRTATGEGS